MPDQWGTYTCLISYKPMFDICLNVIEHMLIWYSSGIDPAFVRVSAGLINQDNFMGGL